MNSSPIVSPHCIFIIQRPTNRLIAHLLSRLTFRSFLCIFLRYLFTVFRRQRLSYNVNAIYSVFLVDRHYYRHRRSLREDYVQRRRHDTYD